MGKWPTGISPHGGGIRIELWKNGKRAYSETVQGDPYKPGDLAAAVKRRSELKSRLDLGLPLRADDASPSRQFVQVAQDFLSTFDGAYSTSLGYEGILNQHWIPAFGHWLLPDITTMAIKKELAKKKDLSQKTLKNIMGPLRSVFAHALDEGLIKHNPAAAVKLKRAQKAQVDRFMPDERARILDQLEGEALLYFALLFGCGLRPGGEVIGLQWPDWNGTELYVHQQIVRRKVKNTTKTYTARKVYVPTWVRPLLNNAPTRFVGKHIFINDRDVPYKDTDWFNGQWKAALKRARVPYRVPYVCRHTRAAELLSTGIQPGDAAAQLGHTLEMFYRTYSEWIEEYAGNRDLSRLEGVNPKLLGGLPGGE